MNIKRNTRRKKQDINRFLILLFMLTLSFVSCKKDDDLSDGLDDGYSTVIRDLAGDTNGSVSGTVEGRTKVGFYTFLFRFSDQKQIWLYDAADSAEWLQTDQWDLAFTGPYNSEVFVNNANDPYNPGYGGAATKGAVLMIDSAYSAVTWAPTDEEFDNSDIIKIGWAQSNDAYGWFFYSLDTHIMVPIQNRTWVIRLASSKYAKLELVNAYQGNPPTVTNLYWPAPYFTFRYYVQQDGSRNLQTN
ncbi:HmuY family protein [Sphingobacterium sp. LRF_L2]|uniref:HmuY family protein n=1 Tax=Sphingobacterium sp. LRF_L2 TaxID=3369421 RepID=UPI003F5FA10F